MNKKARQKVYHEFLKKRTELAAKTIDLSRYMKKPAPKKKYSDKAKKIREAIVDGEFGCNEGAVYKLAGVLTGEDIPAVHPDKEDLTFHLDSKHIVAVPWACYETRELTDEEDGDIISDFCIDCYVSFRGNSITHLCFPDSADKQDLGCFDTDMVSFKGIRFATNAQIKRLVSSPYPFDVIDNVLGFLTEGDNKKFYDPMFMGF